MIFFPEAELPFATNLLNSADGGQRRCILVTSNEVSEKEGKILSDDGYHLGDAEWEKHSICQSVTWPRCNYTMIGKRDDSTELEDEYLSGRIVTKEKLRRFRQISFTNMYELTTAAKKEATCGSD